MRPFSSILIPIEAGGGGSTTVYVSVSVGICGQRQETPFLPSKQLSHIHCMNALLWQHSIHSMDPEPSHWEHLPQVNPVPWHFSQVLNSGVLSPPPNLLLRATRFSCRNPSLERTCVSINDARNDLRKYILIFFFIRDVQKATLFTIVNFGNSERC